MNQTYRRVEIVVVNDAGADVEPIVNDLNRRRNITYVRHDRNRGLAAARNTALKLAKGKYVAYLDDDDVYYPDHLETLVGCLEKEQECQVAYTDAYRAHHQCVDGKWVMSHKDVPFSVDFDHDRILVGNFIPVLCFMHRRDCLDKAGWFDEMLTTHEDWDLWIRFSKHFRFAHIRKLTCEFSWRIDGSTMTSEKPADFLRTLDIIYERYREFAKTRPQVVTAQRQYRSDLVRQLESQPVLAAAMGTNGVSTVRVP